MTEAKDKSRFRSRYIEAMQRHHDYFTALILTQDVTHQGDVANIQLATDRELRWDVRPLVIDGITIVIVP